MCYNKCYTLDMVHAVALRQASPSVEYHSCHLWCVAQFPPCLLVCSHGGATQVVFPK